MASLAQTITITTELRPCYVDGKKALFHKWIDKSDVIIKFNVHGCATKTYKRTLELFKKDKTLPPEVETGKIQNTYGIVEYEDGTIKEVKPQQIKFDDNKMQEYAFTPTKK